MKYWCCICNHYESLEHFGMFISRDGRERYYCPKNRNAGWWDMETAELLKRIVERSTCAPWQRN